MKKLIMTAAITLAAASILAGCSKSDPADTAAPPPRENAVPEPVAAKPNRPGNAGPTGAGSPAGAASPEQNLAPSGK